MSLPDICKQFEPNFLLSDEKLREVVKHFRQEMEEGLDSYGKDMAMIPTFVTGVPNGTEEGVFLALDLGGTNLRVCLVLLQGNKSFKIRQQKYKVSDDLKEGDASQLFGYIADSVDTFLTSIESGDDEISLPANETMHLGFTFSFPVEQTAIDRGKLLTWTKGFNTKKAIGQDVVRILQKAFDARYMHVRCSALVNDTVGTQLSHSYQTGPALIGAIFGTGTNGAYIDKVRTIKKLGDEKIERAEAGGETAGEYMIVNTEWGAFDNQRRCLPVSMFDNKLDRESINPRKQAFEKMISGMYLGEITRNILLYMIDCGHLFDGYSSTILDTHYGFDTSFVSAVEGATSDAQVKDDIIKFLKIDPKHISQGCIRIVRWACRVVSDRACKLSACALAAIIQHTGNDQVPEGQDDQRVLIGMDGSVVEFLPRFNERLMAALVTLLGEKTAARVQLGLAKDGSGVGAALTALQAKKAVDARNNGA